MPVNCKGQLNLNNLCPQLGATRQVRYRTLQQQYGDGYMARRQDGLNPVDIFWKLSTPLMPIKDVQDLEAELIANGTTPFDWTEPFGSSSETWVLDPVAWDWTIQTGDMAQLTFNVRRWYQ